MRIKRKLESFIITSPQNIILGIFHSSLFYLQRKALKLGVEVNCLCKFVSTLYREHFALSLKTEINTFKSVLARIHPHFHSYWLFAFSQVLQLKQWYNTYCCIFFIFSSCTESAICVNGSAFGKSFRVSNHTIIILVIWTLLLLAKASFSSHGLKGPGPWPPSEQEDRSCLLALLLSC